MTHSLPPNMSLLVVSFALKQSLSFADYYLPDINKIHFTWVYIRSKFNWTNNTPVGFIWHNSRFWSVCEFAKTHISLKQKTLAYQTWMLRLFSPHIQAKINLSVTMISWLTKVCELSWQTSYSIQHDKCLAPATSDLGFYTVVSVFDLTVIWSPFQFPVKNYNNSSFVSQWFMSRWLRYKIKYTIVNIVPILYIAPESVTPECCWVNDNCW